MARPTREEARDTRRLILDAALALFSEGGFAGTSMRQIARAVGVRESALYHHFPSKAAIFEALLEDMGPGKSERLDGLDLDVLLAAGAAPLLGLIAHALIEEWGTAQEQKFIRLVLAEAPRLKESGIIHPHEMIERARGRLFRLFKELVRRGLIRQGDPELHFLEFMGPLLLLRLAHMVLAEGAPDMKRISSLVDQHVQHFCDSVKP